MKKFLSLLLAAAMLCTLLVGCGSKSDDSNGDYKPFVEVQGVSDDTILVGNTAATTGAYATVGVPFNPAWRLPSRLITMPAASRARALSSSTMTTALMVRRA